MSHDEMLVDYKTVGDNRDEPRWEPLRVSCEVTTPIVDWQDGLYLDGPLAWVAWTLYRQRYPERAADLPDPSETDWLVDFELPLAKWTAESAGGPVEDDRLLTPAGDVWGWCVSRAKLEDNRRATTAVRGKPPVDQYKRWTDAETVKKSTGPDKPVDQTLPTSSPRQIYWYALGDPEKLREWLPWLTSIGGRRNVGYGEIRTDADGRGLWEVEVIDEDRSLEAEDGSLNARMPYGWNGHNLSGRLLTVRAPRWSHSKRHLMAEVQ